MIHKLEEKLDLFVTNVQAMKKDLFWQDMHIKRLASLLYTLEDKHIDCDEILKCHDLIKKVPVYFLSFAEIWQYASRPCSLFLITATANFPIL